MAIEGKALRHALLSACIAAIVAGCSLARAATSSGSFQITASVPAQCTTVIVPVLAWQADSGRKALRIACNAGQTYSASAVNSANIVPPLPAPAQIGVMAASPLQDLTVVTVTY
jgi:hypothetical protein